MRIDKMIEDWGNLLDGNAYDISADYEDMGML